MLCANIQRHLLNCVMCSISKIQIVGISLSLVLHQGNFKNKKRKEKEEGTYRLKRGMKHLVFVCLFMVLGIELKACSMLGKCSTADLWLQSL